jgi:hypothetical protein
MAADLAVVVPLAGCFVRGGRSDFEFFKAGWAGDWTRLVHGERGGLLESDNLVRGLVAELDGGQWRQVARG